MPKHMRHPGRSAVRATGVSAALACIGLFGIASPMAASAATSGDNNKGDVWVDNVGQPAGPGHEMDPHLACQNINLWGDKLADSSGTYEVDGWPPSGAREQVYPTTTWHYNRSTGGTQVVSVINVKKLVAAAQAAGDAPVNKQGYHFKLQFSQDPQKHKTFWVNCPASPPPPPPSGSVSLCEVAGGYSVAPGTPYTFQVGTQSVTVNAGSSAGDSCVQVPGTFPVGSQVTITQNVPSNQTVSDITVNPSSSVVSENLTQGAVTVSIAGGTTTVTYTDR